MTIEEIKQLIELVNESGVAELEVERAGSRVRIRRHAAANPAPVPQEFVLHPAPGPMAAIPAAAPSAAGVAQATPLASGAFAAADPNLGVVKAPIVGTYYDAPTPGAPPFVKVGDTVQPGQVLCIIESMKLMNEIEAETPGVIAAKLVENGRPVEYGQALFNLRPL